jgi:GH18 family chitinase
MRWIVVIWVLTFLQFVYCAPRHESCTQLSCPAQSKVKTYSGTHSARPSKVASSKTTHAHKSKSQRKSKTAKAATPTGISTGRKTPKSDDKRRKTTSTTAKQDTNSQSSSTMTSPSTSSTSTYIPATPLPKSPWPNHKVIGYYTFSSTIIPLNSIPWSLLTHIVIAFASLDSSNKVTIPTKFESMASQVFSNAIANGVKPVLSIGGYSGSTHFSKMVSSNSSRAVFIASLQIIVEKYNLGGVDIDWEYPGRQASTKIPFDTINDVPNLLLLFQEVRATLGEAVSLSAAVASSIPWTSDMSPFADVVDWFSCMEYNFASRGQAKTGATAPLLGSRSASAGIGKWMSTGLKAEKLVFGLPGYGRSWTLADVPLPVPQIMFCGRC